MNSTPHLSLLVRKSLQWSGIAVFRGRFSRWPSQSWSRTALYSFIICGVGIWRASTLAISSMTSIFFNPGDSSSRPLLVVRSPHTNAALARRETLWGWLLRPIFEWACTIQASWHHWTAKYFVYRGFWRALFGVRRLKSDCSWRLTRFVLRGLASRFQNCRFLLLEIALHFILLKLMVHFARVLNLHASPSDSQLVGVIIWRKPKPRAVFANDFGRGHHHRGVVLKYGTFLWSLTDRPAYWCQHNLITAVCKRSQEKSAASS